MLIITSHAIDTSLDDELMMVEKLAKSTKTTIVAIVAILASLTNVMKHY